MNAEQAKQIADEYNIKQKDIMGNSVKISLEFFLKYIEGLAHNGIYKTYLTMLVLSKNVQLVIPQNKEDELVTLVAEGLEQFGYHCNKNKGAVVIAYDVKWD